MMKAVSMPDAGMVVAGIPGPPPALPVVTTTFATSPRPSTTTTTERNDLFVALPWLKSALSETGLLTSPNGELSLKRAQNWPQLWEYAWQNHTVQY